MASSTIALIGAGHMGSALAAGWQNQKSKLDVALIDPKPSALALAIAEDGNMSVNPPAHHVDVVVIAVKPQIFETVAADIKAWIGPNTLVLSIMAGIRLKHLAHSLATENVLRAMPNTPGAIGCGITAVCAPQDMPDATVDTGVKLLEPLGHVVGPVPEAQMSTITGVSGSGPAYVFLLAEALASAGEAEGLPPELAQTLARETLIGAACLLDDSGLPPETLRKNVTSKHGTTEAALDILMRGDGIPSLIREAVRAAANRERALSDES